MESNYIEFFKTLPDNRESEYTIILKKFVEQEIICDSNKLSIMKKSYIILIWIFKYVLQLFMQLLFFIE